MASVTKKSATISCCCIDHTNVGQLATCDNCGERVAYTINKRGFKRVADLEGDYGFICWNAHKCNPEKVARYTKDLAEKSQAGEIIKGFTVEVYKGRNVPVGTTGKVFWIGTDKWGNERVGFKGTDGETYWTAKSNVKSI